MSKRLKLLSKLSMKDLMPVPPAVAEYSTGISMGQTAEQMAKTHGITPPGARCAGPPLSYLGCAGMERWPDPG